MPTRKSSHPQLCHSGDAFDHESPVVYLQHRWAVPLIILLNLVLTTSLGFLLVIWEDEAFSLNTATRSLAATVQQSLYFELQPPGYFVLLNLWLRLHNSIFFARLFSIICIGLMLWMASKLSQRYFEKTHPGWLTAFLALNPFVVYAAVEIRLYALALALSALLLLLFFDGYLAKSPKKICQWMYVLVAVLALHIQYYMGFILVGNAVALVLLKRWTALRTHLLQMLVSGVASAPLVWVGYCQMQYHTQTVGGVKWGMGVVKFFYGRVIDYLIQARWSSNGIQKVLNRVWLILIVALLVAGRRKFEPLRIGLWIVTAVILSCFVPVLQLTGKQLMRERHTVALFVPLFLSFFSILEIQRKKKLLLACGLVLLVCNLGTLIERYKPLCKGSDYKQAASFLMTHEEDDQPILVHPPDLALPFRYYYKGANRIVSLPQEETCQSYDLHKYVLTGEEDISAALSKVPGNHERVWILTNRTEIDCGYLGVMFNCGVLERFAKKNYQPLLDLDFAGARLRLFQKIRSTG